MKNNVIPWSLMDEYKLNRSERILFAAIHFSITYEKQSEISREKLEIYTLMSVRTITRHLKSLVNKGAIIRVRQGATKPNIYSLTN